MKFKAFLFGSVFLVLFFSSCATSFKPEQIPSLLETRNNQFNIVTRMADDTVPHSQQSFFYMDPIWDFQVKERMLAIYTALGSVVIIPSDEDFQLWGRARDAREWSMVVNFDQGQSYWITDHLWSPLSGRGFHWIIIPLTDEGIESYTRGMWSRANRNLYPYGMQEDWASYEEYHAFIVELWRIRMAETERRLN